MAHQDMAAGEPMKPENLSDNDTKLPLHEDIMQLARLGEIGPIQKLFDEGKYTANYKDEHPETKDVTPLHWAAINNQIALCKFLIDAGADVNVKGGESGATPAMWATQRCHYYVVHLLLQHGADPTLTDAQGNNLLHLATHDGNVYQLLILLHQNISVDIPDPQGNTCLMWAAYSGFPACVELFLQWGASVNQRDNKGFTALHWALVKGNSLCIQKLVESGSDRFAVTDDGKTPATVAQEMKTQGAWNHVLKELVLNTDATSKQPPLPFLNFLKTRTFHTRFFFLAPFPFLIIIFLLMSRMVIFAALPLSIFLAYSMQWAAQQVLLWAPIDMKHLHYTPYLAGVFASTLFWVGFRWLTVIMQSTIHDYTITNLLFLISYSLCAYFYAISMLEDPGYVPKLSSRVSQKAVIEDLIANWKFDDQNFCVFCMIRIPLRSKHCRRCQRCVAKHDHHCPWIHNCVGANNQRHFFLYILALECGIIFFIRLAYYHVISLPALGIVHCNILPTSACEYTFRDPLTVVLASWSALQLVWVTMLLVTQIFLISRAQTTWESMRRNIHRTSRATQAVTSAINAGATTVEGAQISGPGANPPSAGHVGHHHSRVKDSCIGQWTKLLGLDSFVATTSGKAAKRQNAFSRGVITNCKDFWCDPNPYLRRRHNGAAILGGFAINYTSLYEAPPRMRTHRVGDESRAGDYHSVAEEDIV